MKYQPLKKTFNTALLLNIIFTVILLSLIVLIISDINTDIIKNNITFLLIITCGIFAINILILIRSIKINLFLIDKYSQIEKSITNIEDLNNSLRSQRHDFLNHLQVVYGLIELDEFKEVDRYIKDIYTDIQSVSKFLKTSQPAINALIQAKSASAEKNNIKIDLDIKSKLDLLPMDPWEVCRILSNLIDNAIDSLLEKENDRNLKIYIKENIVSYIFMIEDNGPKIPDEIKDKIFDPGFSTKAKEEKGMGLTIVSEIIKEFQGEIRLESNNDSTIFIVEIPIRSNSVI